MARSFINTKQSSTFTRLARDSYSALLLTVSNHLIRGSDIEIWFVGTMLDRD